MSETTDIPKLSPSKITAWLECEHYLTLKNRQNRPKADEPVSEQREDSAQNDNTETTFPAPPKNFSEMLIEKGNFHERECLKRYKEEYGDSVLEVSDKEEGESF